MINRQSIKKIFIVTLGLALLSLSGLAIAMNDSVPSSLIINAPVSNDKILAFTGETSHGVVTIKNTGSSAIAVIDAKVTPEIRGLSVQSHCDSVLASEQSCTYDLHYTAPTLPIINEKNFHANAVTMSIHFSDQTGTHFLNYPLNIVDVNAGYFVALPNYVMASASLPNNIGTSVVKMKKSLYVDTRAGLAISDDKGHYWHIKTTLDDLASDYISGIQVSADEQQLYISTQQDLGIRKDGAANLTTLLKNVPVYKEVVENSGKDIYDATSIGLAIRTNGGDSFHWVLTDTIVYSLDITAHKIYLAT